MGYRDKVWGVDREAEWESLLPEDGLEGIEAKGKRSRRGDEVRCEADGEGAHLIFGGRDWRDYELRCRVEAESGGNVQILFRLSEDGARGYLLDLLYGWQAVAISRVERGAPAPALKLSVVNHELRHGRGYEVELAARGASLTSYIDGKLVNQVTAFEHERGRFALTVWNGKTIFERPMARRLA
jgi:hypothetical protein